MSLKKIACFAALAALVATPVMAQTISVANAGLDANGDWIWNVNLNSSAAGGSSAVEFGATFSGADLLTGGVTTTGSGNGAVEQANPGKTVFGWETLNGQGNPEGLQVDPSQGTNGQAFYAFGTGVLAASSTQLLGTFTTDGPSTTGSLTTGIGIIGAYNASGVYVGLNSTHGVAANQGLNVGVSASGSRTAFEGDVDLNGTVNFDDVFALSPNFGSAVTNGWAGGDFDGNGSVNFDDVFILSPNFGQNQPGPSAGVSAAPEPSSLAIAGLAALSLGLVRRRRA